MLRYNAGITVAKTATPAAVIIIGSKILSVAVQAMGIDITDESIYIAVTAIYSFGRGIVNFFKHRKK